MSTRGTILDAMATQLLTITTANGYSNNIANVYRVVHHPDEANATGVDITILDDAGDAPLQYASAGIVRTSMDISLLVDVWGGQRTEPTDGTHPVSTITDAVIGDIRKLVFAPVSLGANVLFVEMGASEGVAIGERRTRFTIPLAIHYKYDSAAP